MREAERLMREERCVCVIPLTHQAITSDRDLAREAHSPPFPLIIGGHEHTPFVERADATWIVKAGTDAVHAVIVDLAWPDAPPSNGPDLPAVTVRLDNVARYPEDSTLRRRVDGLMRRVHALETAMLVKLAPGEALSSIGTRAHQTSMGALICSRVRDALGAEGCLFNGGGIRGNRAYAGHVTYGDLKAEVPFDNELVVATLPGCVVSEAVFASRTIAPAESGGFLQVDDRMAVDPSGRVTAIDGAPLAPERDYKIAIVRDLFDGMDHNEPLIRFARHYPNKVPPVTSGRDVKLVLVDAFSIALWNQLGGFDAVDANHDGRVTETEIAAAVARFTAEAPSEITADLVMHALDTDHDHTVSRSESDAVAVPPKRS
jgi:2',3'-cyclic-nucleotide 2'-phosphodiesterase (5'-nucleotidase family)